MLPHRNAPDWSAITTIVFINNAISVRLAHADLVQRGIPFEQVALFQLRSVAADWFGACAMVVPYEGKPSHGPVGQLRFVGFYSRAARTLRGLLKRSPIRRVYIVNNDNLLTNHVLNRAGENRDVEVAVVAEGIMNYQDIRLRNRARWRTQSKRLCARLLGMTWEPPSGHLSGAFDPRVSRVISFGEAGLQAPLEKIDVIPFLPVLRRAPVRDDTVLVVYSGLWQWMSAADNERFSAAFCRWLRGCGFRRYLVKPHPHVAAGLIEELMPAHEVVGDAASLEDMASEIEAATVIGMCCTGLITLKMLRPDIRCIDFGADFYCEKAYFGDHTVANTMRAAGVELIDMLDASASVEREAVADTGVPACGAAV